MFMTHGYVKLTEVCVCVINDPLQLSFQRLRREQSAVLVEHAKRVVDTLPLHCDMLQVSLSIHQPALIATTTAEKVIFDSKHFPSVPHNKIHDSLED